MINIINAKTARIRSNGYNLENLRKMVNDAILKATNNNKDSVDIENIYDYAEEDIRVVKKELENLGYGIMCETSFGFTIYWWHICA